MSKKDKELRQIMQYRCDGMEYALKEIKEKGIESFEKDLAMRRLTHIPMNLSVEWVNGIMRDVFSRINNSYIVMIYKTLSEIFGFGKDRLHLFRDEFNKNVDGIATVDNYGLMYYKFQDYAEIFNSKRYDMNIDMDVLMKVDALNEESLQSGKVLREVKNLLEEHGFEDAVNFLKEYMGDAL